jgi:hypothetical protein
MFLILWFCRVWVYIVHYKTVQCTVCTALHCTAHCAVQCSEQGASQIALLINQSDREIVSLYVSSKNTLIIICSLMVQRSLAEIGIKSEHNSPKPPRSKQRLRWSCAVFEVLMQRSAVQRSTVQCSAVHTGWGLEKPDLSVLWVAKTTFGQKKWCTTKIWTNEQWHRRDQQSVRMGATCL